MKNSQNLIYTDGTLKGDSKKKYGIYNKPKMDFKNRKSEKFEDDILYCYECDEEYVGECTTHNSQWILNKKITCPYTLLRADCGFDEYYNENLDMSECFCKTNAIKHIKTTLPNGFFLIKSQVENTTYGVWTRNSICRGTILGPFLGHLTSDKTISNNVTNNIEDGTPDFVWSLVATNNVGDYNLIDARDCMLSNYLRFIRRSRNEHDHNLIPFQFDGKIFYQAVKDISSNEELMVKYAVRTFRPQHCQGSITIRVIPMKDKRPPNECLSIVKKSSISNVIARSTDISDVDEINEEKSNNVNVVNTNDVNVPKIRNYGFKTKVDDDIRNCLKEIYFKNPSMTGAEANKVLREMLPHKPLLSDRTVLSVVQVNGYRPVIGADDVLEESSVHHVVKMFKENPEFTCQDAKEQFETLFPEKPPITFETIDRIVRSNKTLAEPGGRRKINTEMYAFMRKVLKSDPGMSAKDLNKSLKKAFPNRPSISTDYLTQIISRKKLRPFRNAKRKIDDDIKKYTLQLFYKEGLRCNQICSKLNERYPNKRTISDKFVANIIATNDSPFGEDDDD